MVISKLINLIMPAKKTTTAKKAPAKKAAPKKTTKKEEVAEVVAPVEVTAEEVAAAPKVTYRGGEVMSIAKANRPEGYIKVTFASAGSVQETVILAPAEFKDEFGFDVPEDLI